MHTLNIVTKRIIGKMLHFDDADVSSQNAHLDVLAPMAHYASDNVRATRKVALSKREQQFDVRCYDPTVLRQFLFAFSYVFE